MSVSRTAFTRIHRDALPTVKRRASERKRENAHTRAHTQRIALPLGTGLDPYQQCISPHTQGGDPQSGVVVERARQASCPLAAARRGQHTEDREDTREEEGEERGDTAACLAALPFSHSLLSPLARFPFRPFRLAFAFIPFLHNST